MAIPLSVPSLALSGKVAIITGGSTGMGRSIALEFAKADADVVVASRTVANLERVAAEVRALGRRALGGAREGYFLASGRRFFRRCRAQTRRPT